MNVRQPLWTLTLCAIGCASRGVSDIVDELQDAKRSKPLAHACSKRAQFDAEHGDKDRARRLVAAVHYLNYLVFPYD